MTFCKHCEELIEPGDLVSPVQGGEFHFECGFRLLGSLAHWQKRCGCYVPGSTEGDPPGMTVRQAAQAALDYYRKENPCSTTASSAS